MRLLDGATVAAERRAALAAEARRPLVLGAVVATDDSATHAYLERKRAAAEEIGWAVKLVRLASSASAREIVTACERLNDDSDVTGYIVQLPLPDGVDERAVLSRVDPARDADGLAPANLGRLANGDATIVPATARGVVSLLRAYGVELWGRHVVVIGKGRLAGLPISLVMSREGATVTICDEHTADLRDLTRRADIVVAAAGEPGLVTADMVSSEAIVVDVGTTSVDGQLKGDADMSVADRAAALSPVPGGVGPMTVVSLLENLRDLDAQLAR